MTNGIFFNNIQENELNRDLLKNIQDHAKDSNLQLYIISSPLGEKYAYDYENNAIVILSPKHKILFIDLLNQEEEFEEFFEDFVEDLSSISDKFEYKNHIGRPREWKKELTTRLKYDETFDFEEVLEQNALLQQQQRKCELLISLLIGSINDIERVGVDVPETTLEKVRKNILLFDGDQTRFIYEEFDNKTVSIQGLSGTGKTELLLHKLKELYLADSQSRIFFTCHNHALANTLKSRIPTFFDFMKVEKQIEWNSRLWVESAWGSGKDRNSGFYRYLCHFYNIPFLRYSFLTDYNKIFKQVLDHINEMEEEDFEYAFDYLLVDERQDFPKIFFELCEKVVRNKIYVAGDIFQDIFENTKGIELEVDVILNRCYRTDPRTLMFAHAIGLGLFEKKKLNWFPDDYWEAIGYSLTRNGRNIELSRDPIRRFEDLQLEEIPSMVLSKYTGYDQVLEIIKNIQVKNSNVTPNDICVIVLDDHNSIFEYMDSLAYKIINEFEWEVNRAYESKEKVNDALYLTNSNNVKGLEFPFVICVTASIKSSYRYRNVLYTMLTRSFIQSYLLVKNDKGLKIWHDGLDIINSDRVIETIEPTDTEKDDIKTTILKLQKQKNISYKEFLGKIFSELRIKGKCRDKLEKAVFESEIEKFDKEQTVKFINANKEFYCK
jgi:superfamily I DNA and RNA helicase